MTGSGCVSNKLKYDYNALYKKMQQLNDNPVYIDPVLMKSFPKYIRQYNGRSEEKMVIVPGWHGRYRGIKIDSNRFFYYNGDYNLNEYSIKEQLQKQLRFEYSQKQIISDITLIDRIDNLFNYKEIYYPSGKIKSKAIYCNKGFYIAKTYSFDEDGRVIDIKDNDKGFGFTFDDVFRFCNKEHLLDKSKKELPPLGQTLFITNLSDYWTIEIARGGRSGHTRLDIKLDQNTGNVLSIVLYNGADHKEISIKPNRKRIKYIRPIVEQYYKKIR